MLWEFSRKSLAFNMDVKDWKPNWNRKGRSLQVDLSPFVCEKRKTKKSKLWHCVRNAPAALGWEREKRQFYFFAMPLFGAIIFQMYNDSANCKNGFSFPIKVTSWIYFIIHMTEYEHSHKKVNDVSINRTKHTMFWRAFRRDMNAWQRRSYRGGVNRKTQSTYQYVIRLLLSSLQNVWFVFYVAFLCLPHTDDIHYFAFFVQFQI